LSGDAKFINDPPYALLNTRVSSHDTDDSYLYDSTRLSS